VFNVYNTCFGDGEMTLDNSDDKEMTFSEFKIATASEGHPLYKGISEGRLANFREYVYQCLTLKVLPKALYPADTGADSDHSNVACLPKRLWHDYYGEALGAFIKSMRV